VNKKEESHPEPRDLVLYKNTDLYSDEKNGPAASFYQELYKYKSVQEYLDKKNKKRKRVKRRKKAFYVIASSDINRLDFSIDSHITPIPNSPSISGANQIGGVADHVTQSTDFSGQDIGTNLNYGVAKDYPPNLPIDSNYWNRLIDILADSFSQIKDEKNVTELVLSPAEPSVQGIPDGIVDKEDQDHTYTNTGYGITDSGNKSYQGVPFPTNRY
jgi:hypothetical protein